MQVNNNAWFMGNGIFIATACFQLANAHGLLMCCNNITCLLTSHNSIMQVNFKVIHCLVLSICHDHPLMSPSLRWRHNEHDGASNHHTHDCCSSLAFVRGIHRWPVISPHKRPVTQKKLPFDDIIMNLPLRANCDAYFESSRYDLSSVVFYSTPFNIKQRHRENEL